MAADFSKFMRQNRQHHVETKLAVSKYFLDDNGRPLEWSLRPISTKRFEEIRDESVKRVALPGGGTREDLDNNLLNAKLIAACVTYPDLRNAELQDSYGATSPDDLIVRMVDDFGEYRKLLDFVLQLCGLRDSLEEKAEEAKNS